MKENCLFIVIDEADEAVDLVRDGDLDDGAGMHVAQGKAELQGNVRTGIFGLGYIQVRQYLHHNLLCTVVRRKV